MPLKKKEEVCGKPTQYNLQTLEYDWRELPDTHFQLPPQKPRVRNYSVAPASPAAAGVGQARLNPITHQPLPSSGRGPSYTPLPSPSRPAQEDARGGPPGRFAHNDRRDNVADLFGGSPAPRSETPRNSPQPPAASPVAPAAHQQYDAVERGAVPVAVRSPPPNLNPAYVSEVAVSPGYRGGGDVAVLPWTHEDIRRVVTANALEAQRSYLR